LQKSKLTVKAEEFTYHPNTFYINYTVNSSKDGRYARNMLETILKNYYKFYGERYLNQSMVPEIPKSIKIGEYDYIEVAETLSSNVNGFISFLIAHNKTDKTFRSSKTGLTFTDLENEYNVIKNVDMKLLFSYIYFGRLTINKEELIKKYQYKIEEATQKSTQKSEEASAAIDILNKYSQNNASKPGNNSNGDHPISTSEVIKDDIFKSSQTTYDKVINQYVDAKVNSSDALTDVDDYNNIINIYQKDTISSEQKEEFTEKVKETTIRIENKLKTLNELTDLTLTDFHNYNVSKYISCLSSVNIVTNYPLKLYMVISFALGAGMGIVFAITIEIGRKLYKSKSDNNSANTL
jgi:hypothetical protein